MAVTQEARRLTEAHRLAQAELSASTMRDAIALWPLLVENPQRNQATWLAAVLMLIRRNRSQSARYAVDYLRAFRTLELGPEQALSDRFEPLPAPEVPDLVQKWVDSAISTGPAALAERAKKLSLERVPANSLAMRNIRDTHARTLQMHVVNGGRDTIDDTIRRDKRVLGYMRVTDGDPCHWCAMLLSRGPVFGKDSFDESDERFFGPGSAKVHAGCGCSLRPIYRLDDPGTGDWRRWEALWKQTGAKKSGAAAVKEFRHAVEQRGAYALPSA